MPDPSTIRKIEGRVDISYGNEDVTDALEYVADSVNPVNNFRNLYNNNHAPKVRAFTLEGNEDNRLDRVRQLIDRDIAGWWSTTFSSSTAADGGYPFSAHPTLNIDFGKKRPIKIVELFGDPQLKEYPVKFRISLSVKTESSKRVVYDRTFRNDAAVKPNEADRIERVIDLLTDGSVINGTESFATENGYITDITDMEVELLSWNKPNCMSKIYRCYDNILEHYMQDELKSFECVTEIANNGDIKYGLVSNSCSVTLLNNKKRKFDLGYLADLAHINRRVTPYLNEKKLGTYFIKEWDISQDNMFVECKANDRLLDFQDMTYMGFMPGSIRPDDAAVTQGGVQTLSFGQLFAKVLDFANENYVRKFKTDIDARLFDTSEARNPLIRVEPYLPRESVWSVLQALCEASLSFVYIDREDTVCVRTELFGREETPSVLTVDTANAFSINVPFFADMAANSVEIPFFRKTVKTEQELYKISGVSKSAGTVEFDVEFDDFCEIDNIALGEKNYKETFIKEKQTDFKYRIIFDINTNVTDVDFVVYGNKITFEKQTYSQQDARSVKENALNLYTHPDCKLLRSKELAMAVAERIMGVYKADTRTASSVWRGDEKLNAFDSFGIVDRFGGKAEYMATYIKHTVDGGYRQEVKGIRTKLIDQGHYDDSG